MCNFWGNLVLGHNFEFICNFFWHQDRVNFGYKNGQNDGFILSKIVHSAPPGLKALIQVKVQNKRLSVDILSSKCV